MSRFVVASSVALAWCFRDEATTETDLLLDQVRETTAAVPALWHLELANVLLQAEKRRRISAADTAACFRFIAALPISTDLETPARAWHETLLLARTEGLTSYDAAYLELALRLGSALLTLDAKLAEAARRHNVAVYPQ